MNRIANEILKVAKLLLSGIKFENVKVGMKAIVKDEKKKVLRSFEVNKVTKTLIILSNGKKYDKYGFEMLPPEKKGTASWLDQTTIDIPESYK